MSSSIAKHTVKDLSKGTDSEGILIYHENDGRDYDLELHIEPKKGGVLKISSPFGNKFELSEDGRTIYVVPNIKP